MAVLFDDVFKGPGTLGLHVSDTGQTWFLLGSTDGVVADGLRSATYPSTLGGLEARSGRFVTTTGKFVAVAVVDLDYLPGVYGGAFDFGVYRVVGGSPGPCTFGFIIYDSGVFFSPGVGGAIEVTGLVQGVNVLRVELEVGTRNGTIWVNDSVLFSGQILNSFAPIVPDDAGAYIAFSNRMNVTVQRLWVGEDGTGPGPGSEGEFWTNIIRAAETP